MARLDGVDGIDFFSTKMRQIALLSQKYHSDRAIPIIIEGETGTGKEVIAKLIHYGNKEVLSPFVDINCAALTPSLFESELFGYEAGSFTGGITSGKKGKLDMAEGGTLFLDEIGDLPLELQGKLLRVIQEREFYRVGGLKKINTDVRIVCATNADLKKKMEQGSFRQDLYFRLKVGHLVIPPLRQRIEEILPLASIFLNEFSKQREKKISRIGNEAAKILQGYSWPGNVRELRNMMEWIVFMYDEVEVKPVHLGELIPEQESGIIGDAKFQLGIDQIQFNLPAGDLPLEKLLLTIVHQAIKMHQGNKTETARYLGISRGSLYNYLKKMESSGL